jgi:hypothetical protein
VLIMAVFTIVCDGELRKTVLTEAARLPPKPGCKARRRKE